jgi:hypothetical protein
MYEYHIQDMVQGLINDKVIPETSRDLAKKALDKVWADKIAIVWGTEDVIGLAKEQKKVITEEQARQVLDAALQDHDCEYGITWETLNSHMDFILDEGPQ